MSAATKWRGGTPPGRPKKGQETKKRVAERVESDEFYAEITRQAKESHLDLYNPAEPSVAIVKEKFEHRAIAYMRASGLSRKEIFERLGGQFHPNGAPISGTAKYSYTHLGNILQQPWFRKRVVELQHEAGFDQIEASIKAVLPEAVDTVVEIMEDRGATPAARLNAANSILDRGLGKPVQRVEQNNTNSHTHVIDDARQLDREMEIIQQELKQLGAS
jgi:hypothetical protein